MKQNIIHLFDFPIKCKRSLYIGLEKKFFIKLIKTFRKNFKTYNEAGEYLSNRAIKYELNIAGDRDKFYKWLKGGRIPLWALIEINKLVRFDRGNIYKNILYYGLNNSPIMIIKPKLPITINPVFISLIGHFIGDGCNSDKYSSVYYAQHRKEYAELFANKIEYVFGKFGTIREDRKFRMIKVVDQRHNNKGIRYEIKLSHFIREIIEKFTQTNDWYGGTVTIPKIIFKLDRLNKIAFLSALIIDEGNIDDSNVRIATTNKNLAEDIFNLIKDIGYLTKIYIRKTPREYFITIKSIKDLLNDLKSLISIYGCCDLGVKLEKIKLEKKIIENNFKLNIKRCILNSLEKKPKSINDLKRILLVRRDKINYHIKQLEKKNKVYIKDKQSVFGGIESVWDVM